LLNIILCLMARQGVGLEDVEDLKEDLARGLAAI